MLDYVEHDMRENSEGDCDAYGSSPANISKSVGQGCEQNASTDRMRVGKKVEMYGVRRDAGMFDAEIGEENPE